MKKAKEDVAAISSTISAIEVEAAKSTSERRNILDNISYRQNKKVLKGHQQKLEDYDLAGARKAYRKYDDEFDAARKKETDLASQVSSAHMGFRSASSDGLPYQQARLGGEIQTDKKVLNEKREELATEYKDIKKGYTEQLVRVKVCQHLSQKAGGSELIAGFQHTCGCRRLKLPIRTWRNTAKLWTREQER